MRKNLVEGLKTHLRGVSKEYLEFFRRLAPYCYKLVYHNAETVAHNLMDLIQ